MDDRALLEAAAKAAGLDLWHEDVFTNGLTRKMSANGVLRWNPLTDSGDALDLAVKLGIGMCHHIKWSQVFSPRTGIEEFKHDDDPIAATRRAIVRAAAALAPKD